jgi:hypothetical protein
MLNPAIVSEGVDILMAGAGLSDMGNISSREQVSQLGLLCG